MLLLLPRLAALVCVCVQNERAHNFPEVRASVFQTIEPNRGSSKLLANGEEKLENSVSWTRVTGCHGCAMGAIMGANFYSNKTDIRFVKSLKKTKDS